MFIRLCWVFVVACRIFSCGMWTLSWGMEDLVPWPGMEPRPSALGMWSLSHWSTREGPADLILSTTIYQLNESWTNCWSSLCHSFLIYETDLTTASLANVLGKLDEIMNVDNQVHKSHLTRVSTPPSLSDIPLLFMLTAAQQVGNLSSQLWGKSGPDIAQGRRLSSCRSMCTTGPISRCALNIC